MQMTKDEYQKKYYCNCPKCGELPQFRSNEKGQWAVCEPCSIRWLIGKKVRKRNVKCTLFGSSSGCHASVLCRSAPWAADHSPHVKNTGLIIWQLPLSQPCGGQA